MLDVCGRAIYDSLESDLAGAVFLSLEHLLVVGGG
jgi:hypothetical protein